MGYAVAVLLIVIALVMFIAGVPLGGALFAILAIMVVGYVAANTPRR